MNKKYYSALVLKNEDSKAKNNFDLSKPSLEDSIKTTELTKQALEKFSDSKIRTFTTIKNLDFNRNQKDNKIIKYTPFNNNSENNNNTSNEKIIKISSRAIDPLENIKFKHRKLPYQSHNEPVPIMHSPKRKVTLEDQRNWKIPPCVSSSKNPKGLVIPLDIRIMNDGRNYIEYKANSNFSKFADVLFIAEKNARAEIEERNKIQESLQIKANLKKEEELKMAAKQARMDKANINNSNSNNIISNISSINTYKSNNTSNLLLGKARNRSLEEEIKERNELRKIRQKQINDERKIEINQNKRQKINNSDRDISEKIALGQAQPSMPLIDDRLYNQYSGLDDGFKDEENNDLYDKPLFNKQTGISNIYKAYYNNDSDISESKNIINKIITKGKMFEGASEVGGERKGPVQFEKSNKQE